MVVGMLLLSSIGTACLGYYTREVWGVGHVTHSIIFWMCVSQSTQNLFFNLSHFFLAYKYKMIAKNVPCQLDGV
jgi:hypothetical protein